MSPRSAIRSRLGISVLVEALAYSASSEAFHKRVDLSDWNSNGWKEDSAAHFGSNLPRRRRHRPPVTVKGTSNAKPASMVRNKTAAISTAVMVAKSDCAGNESREKESNYSLTPALRYDVP